jgi:6-phosphofructokinase 1
MVPGAAKFKTDSERILCDDRSKDDVDSGADLTSRLTFEVAGPRERIYFDPAKTTAAVVTCGGLSPGLNDVIRGIVMELWYGYHVSEIDGIRYGYEGLVQKHGHLPLKLRPETVSNIQSFGGTILGSSRGPQDIGEMVDGLAELGVDILFAIGGDGTPKGARALAAEIQRRGLRKSDIAIPKTIDRLKPTPKPESLINWPKKRAAQLSRREVHPASVKLGSTLSPNFSTRTDICRPA